MKRLFLIVLCTLQTPQVWAQDSAAASEPLRIGVSALAKAAINTSTVPTGWKTGVTMDGFPDLYLTALIPIKSSMGIAALIDVGISSQAVLTKPYPNPSDSSTIIIRSRYLSISPSFALPYAYLGVNIGVPIAASRVSNDGSSNLHSVESGGNTTSLVNQMALLVELRLGGNLPLIEDSHGTLSLVATAGYQLGSSFKSFTSMSPVLYGSSKTTTSNDPQLASLSVGLRYLFDLGSQN